MTRAEEYTDTRLEITLQRIAYDLVHDLGYVGAMVSTYEPEEGAIPVRAFYVDPQLATMEQIHKWEERVGRVLNRPVNLSDPDFARVYAHKPSDQDNLSVRAYKRRRPIVSESLYSLFTPVAPASTQRLFDTVIKSALDIEQVIAVPFFLESPDGSKPEIVGNLFAAKREPITEQDERLLTAVGRQAASAIEIERQRLRVLRVARQLTTEIQTHIEKEDSILQNIVDGVVNVLGYVGAMMATYEPEDHSLPLRAVCFDPSLDIEKWENRIFKLMRNPISIANPDPKVARVYVTDEAFQDNLSVKAVNTREPVVDDNLASLLVPFVPPATKPVLKLLQRTVGINEVIAVPFFLEKEGEEPELVGNLFAATTSERGFRPEEIELLQAFGQQAAAGIRNARLYREVEQLYTRSEQQRLEIESLYRKAEERREVSELFGKMAFSASANVHALRNHLGAFSTHLQLLLMYKNTPDKLGELMSATPRYLKRLQEASRILDSLHEPWRRESDQAVAINEAVKQAITKVCDQLNFGEMVHIERSLAPDLPAIQTSPAMLVEAFKILIKNGMEAILEKHRGDEGAPGTVLGVLSVETHYLDESTLEVVVQDNGIGVRPENLSNIFDLHWSTKSSGMGFGLFWLKDYVEGLDGRVWVDSVYGEGTTFHVLLPAPE